MLRWLGGRNQGDFGLEMLAAAGKIDTAVERVFANPALRTRDMGGTLSTGEMTEAVIEVL
jgi:isocitrate/isopropylmalate dehydrogenase